MLSHLIQLKRKKETIHTNADRIIGMVAVVSESFKENSVGKVTVNGQTWRAIGVSNDEFFIGEKVQVP